MPIFTNKRDQHFYHNHYSDQRGDMGAPIGSIIAVYVDAHSTTNGVLSDDSVSYNYPGYIYCEGQDLNISDYPLLYEAIGNKYGGANPNTVDMKTWNGSKTGRTGHTAASIDLGTFKLPDLRMKRINGPGGIDGAGSLTPDEAPMEVGDVGGEWYISRARQLKEYTFGTVRVSGYTSVTGFITGSLSGQANIDIGPLEEKTLQGPPPHNHRVFASEHETRSTMDQNQATHGGAQAGNVNQIGYTTGYGQIITSEPDRGFAAPHSHWLAEYRPVRSGSDAALDEPKDMYSYDISETYAHEFSTPSTTNPAGQVVYTTTNGVTTTHTWIAPAGVTSVDVCCVGGGSGGMGGIIGGGGGGLGYKNNIPVTPGGAYTVVVGAGGTGTTSIAGNYNDVKGNTSYFISASTVCGKGGGELGTPPTSAMGGGFIGDGGGNGGHGTPYGGGGGCGGYSGQGGGFQNGNTFSYDAAGGSGGGGAGGDCSIPGANNGAGGGGTGLLGIGQTGAGASGNLDTTTTTYTTMFGGGPGSGGQAGENTHSPLIKTTTWVAVGASNISSGSANVWTQFMLDHAIYPSVPNSFSTQDPYLGTTQYGGYTIWVDAAGIASVDIELACDGAATLEWVRPNDPPGFPQVTLSTSSGGTTPSVTGTATNLVEGYHVIKWQINNGAFTGTNPDNTWGNNPGGIAIECKNGSTTVFETRTFSTGGIHGYGDAKGGDGGYPGGGGGALYHHSNSAVASDPGDGADGAVRIMWGPGRSYPSAAADTPEQTADAPIGAYEEAKGAWKHNDGKNNENSRLINFIASKSLTPTPAQAGISLNEGQLTMTGAEQIDVSAGIVPRQAVPLVLKYFRVKYLIKAW